MKFKGKRFGILLTFCIMAVFWVLLSGIFDAFHLISGLVCCAIVSLISHDLLVKGESEKKLLKSLRLLIYIPWELWQIVLANIDVAYRVLHPRMPIDPQIIEFETTLRGDFSLVTLANSITLTPGTITIEVEPDRGKFVVHAIGKEPADALLVDQTMQKKVAHVFMETAVRTEDLPTRK
ncbi:MAG: Na+/H+ antiporter subunit E [Syntrophaceae bacterium]|nr:Na+/H+ antiporter subunit E [Syntrophaceae bacterium]